MWEKMKKNVSNNFNFIQLLFQDANVLFDLKCTLLSRLVICIIIERFKNLFLK